MRHSPALCLFVSCLIMLVLAAGEAQNTSLLNPASSSPSKPSLERKIEVLIRSQFSVPPEYDIQLGARIRSNIGGYDTLPVTFIHDDKRTSVEFLVWGVGRSRCCQRSHFVPERIPCPSPRAGRAAVELKAPKWRHAPGGAGGGR